MSVQGLYRVMVRMLYDPAFADTVYAGDAVSERLGDLTPGEREYLARPDRRAWGTDPMRRLRSLTALVEEYPAASALLARRGREGRVTPELPALDAFFSSDIFHDAVQQGRSMVLAYGRFLGEADGQDAGTRGRLAPVARIETSIATLRREPTPPSAPEEGGSDPDRPRREPDAGAPVRLAAHVRILELPEGSGELYRRIFKSIRASGLGTAEAVLSARWSLPVLLETDPVRIEFVTAEKRAPGAAAAPGEPASLDEDVSVTTVNEHLGTLLRRAARGPFSWSELLHELRRSGASADGEDGEIARYLVAENLLRIDP